MKASGFISEAYAAGQMPMVSGLELVDTGSGLSARCSYRYYGTDSNYTIRLYLDEWTKEEGATVRENKVLEKSATGDGQGMTDPAEVDSGIYYIVAAVRDDGTVGATAQFYETEKYCVTRTDGGYQITPWTEDTGKADDGKSEEIWREKEIGGGERESDGKSCEHSFETVLIRQPDADHDAVTARQCSICGSVAEYMEVPNSAYAFFQRDTADRILEMTEGEITIDTARWISFHRMVTDAMLQRPKVQITVHFRYKGKEETVVIPAGADRDGLANEDGFCGFLYLQQRYAKID